MAAHRHPAGNQVGSSRVGNQADSRAVNKADSRVANQVGRLVANPAVFRASLEYPASRVYLVASQAVLAPDRMVKDRMVKDRTVRAVNLAVRLLARPVVVVAATLPVRAPVAPAAPVVMMTG